MPDIEAEIHQAFGGEVHECEVVSAPGRVNLIGEHIDYHGLEVLPIALRRFVRVASRPRVDRRIRATSATTMFADGGQLRPTRTREPAPARAWPHDPAQAGGGKGRTDSGMIRARFSLEGPNNRSIGKETQTYTFRGDDRTRTIDCEYVFYALGNAIVFGDTKEGTFAVRLNAELSTPHDHMLNSRGAAGEPAIWGKAAEWVNYSGTVAGKTVGVVAFDHPSSFRHPTTWHARAYGLLAANPFAAREFTNDEKQDGSWTVPERNSITFRYRVVIYDGQFTPAQLADLYKRFAAESATR